MLLWLADYLSQFYSPFSVVKYLTLRGIFAVITALTICWVLGPRVIRLLNDLQMGQAIRSDGPQSHLSKAGTPTMGGALILVAIFISTLLWANLENTYVWVVLGVTFGFGLIGWVDDYRKVVHKNPRGLPARWKYFWQSLCGLAAAVFLFANAASPAELELIVPFFKNVAFNLGPFYILFTYFVIVGTSNAVNLTDGLDGLAILPTVLVGGALGIDGLPDGQLSSLPSTCIFPISAVPASYLFSPRALCGAGLGFLWFNTYPAMVFMGDVGSLALGAALGVIAVIIRQEDCSRCDGRCVCDRNGFGDLAGRLFQADWQAYFPYGPTAPPLRIKRLARAARDCALLDYYRCPGSDWPSHIET